MSHQAGRPLGVPGKTPRIVKSGGSLVLMKTIVLLGAILAVGIAQAASPSVLCRKKNGAIFVRESCSSKEKQLDPAQIGVVGPKGESGVAGPQGTSGFPGVTGPQGAQGVRGPAGPAGPAGASIQGPAGAQGPAGPKGDIGSKGDTGSAG